MTPVLHVREMIVGYTMEDPPPSSYSREMRNSAESAFSASTFDNLTAMTMKHDSLQDKDKELTSQQMKAGHHL